MLAAPKQRRVGVDISEPGVCDQKRTRYLHEGKLLAQWRECQCGACGLEGSQPPACIVCEACGSTLAVGPDDHEDPAPHAFGTDGHCGFCGLAEVA